MEEDKEEEVVWGGEAEEGKGMNRKTVIVLGWPKNPLHFFSVK